MTCTIDCFTPRQGTDISAPIDRTSNGSADQLSMLISVTVADVYIVIISTAAEVCAPKLFEFDEKFAIIEQWKIANFAKLPKIRSNKTRLSKDIKMVGVHVLLVPFGGVTMRVFNLDFEYFRSEKQFLVLKSHQMWENIMDNIPTGGKDSP